MRGTGRVPWLGALVGAVCLTAPVVHAESGNPLDPVPTQIVFLIDASSSMGECPSADRADLDGDGVAELCLSGSRLDAVRHVLAELSGTLGSTRLALAQTDPTSTLRGIGSRPSPFTVYPTERAGIMAPLGSSASTFQSALAALTLTPVDALSLAESLRDLVYHLFTGYLNCNDRTLCASSPIRFACQETHIVLITDGTSAPGITVDTAPLFHTTFASPDITTTMNPAADNVASFLANADLSPQAGVQHVRTWVLGIDVSSASSLNLLQSVATNGDGEMRLANSEDSLRMALSELLGEIVSGRHQEAPPVVTSDGDAILVGWYDASPVRPLYRGHLARWSVDSVPGSPTWGELLDPEHPDWDAGVILEDRGAVSGEESSETPGHTGEGPRDIYTDLDGDAVPDVLDASTLSTSCPLLLDLSAAPWDGAPQPGLMAGHDLDGDLDVDEVDCRHLLDFVRGVATEPFVGSNRPRGAWKLGSIRHGQPAIAEPRPILFTRNPHLRAFVDTLLPTELITCPPDETGPEACAARVAFSVANDGMLHAFHLPTGRELWAMVPRSLLGQTAPGVSRAALVDLMSGEAQLLDATVRLALVWVDGYAGEGTLGVADGIQTANEWLRVLLVGQGEGGRHVLALDVTQPDTPWILWEDTSSSDPLAHLGATSSTPAVGLAATSAGDRWVAYYGSGRAVDGQPVDARLFVKDVGDIDTGTERFEDAGIEVTVDLDHLDGHDGGGLSGSPLLVDRDADGATDEVYIAAEAGVLYKFVIDPEDPDQSVSCLFFDPEDATLDTGETHVYVAPRADAAYPPTAAWGDAGELYLYWGTGSPWTAGSPAAGHFYLLYAPPGCEPAQLKTSCEGDGELTLGAGEALTGTPIVWDGIIYFTTWQPSADRCSEGQARLYGMDDGSCSAAFDTDASGVSGDNDDLALRLNTGLPSEPIITHGSLYVATSHGAPEGDGVQVTRFDLPLRPLGAAAPIQWREMY